MAVLTDEQLADLRRGSRGKLPDKYDKATLNLVYQALEDWLTTAQTSGTLKAVLDSATVTRWELGEVIDITNEYFRFKGGIAPPRATRS